MKKRIFPLLGFLLLFSTACFGQFYILESHSIDIAVDQEGMARVRERYFLFFQNEQQLAEFRGTVSSIGVSIDGWKSYDPRICPRIGSENEISVSGISFIENTDSTDFLELAYSLEKPLMEKKSETSTAMQFNLNTGQFSSFIDGSLWVIPEGTSITVHLPKGVQIEKPVKPDALIEGNAVTWSGYVFGNELELNYTFFKQIASFDLGGLISQLMQSNLFLAGMAAAAIAVIIVFVKRKALSEKIENYVVSNSEFSEKEE